MWDFTMFLLSILVSMAQLAPRKQRTMYVRPQLFLPPARGDRIAKKEREQKRKTTRKFCENEAVVKY